MAEHSKIEWTDATWNPITGCTMVSAGCTNCYAMGLAATRLKHHPSRAGLTRMTGGRAVWTGDVRLNTQWLDQPLRWRRPRLVFVCAHGDLFHENVPDEWIDRVFAVMAMAPQHTFQVLTKRPERMQSYFDGGDGGRLRTLARVMDAMDTLAPRGSSFMDDLPLTNVWLGTSAEDQVTAEARIPHLLATPAAVRFVSAEPLLGPVDLVNWIGSQPYLPGASTHIATDGYERQDIVGSIVNGLDWIIVGGESGKKARPMHPDWARSLRDQCRAAGVAFHFKQWGEWEPRRGFACPDGLPTEGWHHFDPECSMRRVGKRAAGRLLDGRTWDELPVAFN